MFDTKALGKRVLYYRNQKKLSQKKLASLCNMSQSTISDIENGKIGTANIVKLSILADALNVSLNDLLFDSIDVLQRGTYKDISPYEYKLKQLLLTLDKEELEFSNCLIDNFISLKKLYHK